MKARPSLRASRGFTLIELMVALVVSSIVVLGIFAFSSIQQSTTNLHDRDVKVQQALEGAMWTMSQDVRASGLGFSRLCTELRVWDADNNRLLNPGAAADPTAAPVDAVTGEAFWVLRDGLQAHWRSDGATSIEGSEARSGSPSSAADSFDVILGEANYLDAMGVFTLTADPAGDAFLTVRTAATLDSTNADHLAQVRQLFPPGGFIALAVAPGQTEMSFRADAQSQCVLLQVTGDVQAGSAADLWQIPIAATSGFNANVNQLLTADTNGTPACPGGGSDCDDWVPDTFIASGPSVLPLGRLRWSRYEIDYTVPNFPYLVRYDIIGYVDGEDPANLAGVDYPHCNAGSCPAPQLHLPGGDSAVQPPAVAVGPMIEDMQVAVGCDGWSVDGAANAEFPLVAPDPDYEERGPAEGTLANLPNYTIDENTSASGERAEDEWLGNARTEIWAPDCVFYGTGEYNRAGWETVESAQNPPPAFRMSPQTIRITLVGSSETPESAGGLATPLLMAIEDRAPIASSVGNRQRFTLTERVTPENLRWRDPTVP